MENKTIAAILPLSDREPVRRNIDRAKMLLNSLSFFWRDEEPLEIFIVTPNYELDHIKSSLSRFVNAKNISLRFMNEDEVSPLIGSASREYGIAKHMLIKIAAAEFSGADYYVVLDSDIVLCKQITRENLIINGRALTEYLTPSMHDWYNKSAEVLRYQRGTYDLGKPRLFVTPEILSSDIVRRMTNFIQNLHGSENWLDVLLKNFSNNIGGYWTEYTLYDLYAEHENLFSQYHLLPNEIKEPLHCMEQSIWSPEAFEKWDPAKAFDGRSAGYFLVLQSITANTVDFEEVQSRVYEALGGAFEESRAMWIDAPR